MTEINSYFTTIQENNLDFTRKPRFSALCDVVLSVAGYDANTIGWGIQTIGCNNLSWVLSRMSIQWDRIPKCFEKLEIKTWVSDVNRLMSTRNFIILDASGNQIASAVTLWAMIDISSRQPVDLRDMLDPKFIVDRPSPLVPIRRIPSPEPQIELSHTVSYSDLDFNNHTNTLKYIEWLCDTMPLDWFNKHFVKRFDIHFINEALYGQRLVISRQTIDQTASFEIKNQDQTCICKACMSF